MHRHHAVVPELVLGELPTGSHVLIMTHDHAEDAALCDAALRCGHLASIGLIGSSAKWRRFEKKLAAEGHGPDQLARITTPIGLPEITGKDPATIAVGVAADLVLRFERAGTAATGSSRAGSVVTIYRATVLDTPESPFAGGRLRAEDDCGIAVTAGAVVDRGPFARVRAARPDDEVVDLTGGVLLPGLVDTHVHFPQVRVIGGLGMPLLDWLKDCALPEEARMADTGYARHGRRRVRGRAACGPGRRPRSCSGRTTPPRSTSSSSGRRRSGCGSRAGSSSATGSCAPNC